MQRVGESFERSIPEQCEKDKKNGQQLDRRRHAQEGFGVRHHQVFILCLYLRRGAPGDERHSHRRPLGIGVDANNEIFVAHCWMASFLVSLGINTGFGSGPG